MPELTSQQVLRTPALRFKHLEGFKIHTTIPTTTPGRYLKIQSDRSGTLHVANKKYRVKDKRNATSQASKGGTCDQAPGPSLNEIPACIDNLPVGVDLSMLDNCGNVSRPQTASVRRATL